VVNCAVTHDSEGPTGSNTDCSSSCGCCRGVASEVWAGNVDNLWTGLSSCNDSRWMTCRLAAVEVVGFPNISPCRRGDPIDNEGREGVYAILTSAGQGINGKPTMGLGLRDQR
jgi:hypothetical protein